MKSLFVLLLSVFTFGIAPNINGLRSNVYASKAPIKKGIDFEVFELPKPAPAPLLKPTLAPGERWVPLLKLKEEVSEDSTRTLVSQIKDANDQGASVIVLEINSPGGSVPDGFELAKAIEESKVPVVCTVDSSAYSMASYLLESCQMRTMVRRASLMLHGPSIQGNIGGQSGRFANIAEMLRIMTFSFAQQYASRAKVSADYILSKMDNGKEWWIGYREALKDGLIDHAVKSVDAVVQSYKKHGSLDKSAMAD